MLLKALCGIIYGGTLYAAGDKFEADKRLDNTEVVSPAEKPAPEKESKEPPKTATKTNTDKPKPKTFDEVLAESKSKKSG